MPSCSKFCCASRILCRLPPWLNGDYISDALAAQVGGIGIAPGANLWILWLVWGNSWYCAQVRWQRLCEPWFRNLIGWKWCCATWDGKRQPVSHHQFYGKINRQQEGDLRLCPFDGRCNTSELYRLRSGDDWSHVIWAIKIVFSRIASLRKATSILVAFFIFQRFGMTTQILTSRKRSIYKNWDFVQFWCTRRSMWCWFYWWSRQHWQQRQPGSLSKLVEMLPTKLFLLWIYCGFCWPKKFGLHRWRSQLGVCWACGIGAFGRYMMRFAKDNKQYANLLNDKTARETTEPFLTNETFHIFFELMYELEDDLKNIFWSCF